MKLSNFMNSKNIFICLSIIVFVLLIVFPANTNNIESYKDYNDDLIYDFKKGKKITQEFISKEKYNRFGFKVATYSKIFKKGYLIVNINQENKKSKTLKYKLSLLSDNNFVYFKYKLKKGKKYKIEITSDSNDSIAIYTTKSKVKDAILKVDDNKKDSNLILSFCYKKREYSLFWPFFLVMSIISCFFVLKEDNYEKK